MTQIAADLLRYRGAVPLNLTAGALDERLAAVELKFEPFCVIIYDGELALSKRPYSAAQIGHAPIIPRAPPGRGYDPPLGIDKCIDARADRVFKSSIQALALL